MLDFQCAINGLSKGRLSACKRWPFTVRKTAFRTVKDGLLHGMLPQVGIQQTAN